MLLWEGAYLTRITLGREGPVQGAANAARALISAYTSFKLDWDEAAAGANGVTIAIRGRLSRMCRSPVISMIACLPVAPMSFRASTR